MDKSEDIIRMMFSHFYPEKRNLKHYDVRREFIETFTPVIKSLNETYSHLVEENHIEKYGFRLISTITFKNYMKSFVDDNSYMIEFDFKNRTMSITNAYADEFVILRKSQIPNLLTFETIMNALGFNCT